MEEGGVRVPTRLVLACAVALAAAWLVDYAVLRPPFPTHYRGQAPLAPLYAFWMPVFRAHTAVFVVLGLVLWRASAVLADPARVGRRAFAAYLGVAAVLLPLALFLVRQDPSDLGSQFEIYRDEEFLHDARRIGSLSLFLDRYVENMASLSLHGSHFPPGNAVLLYAVGSVFGFGALPAGIAVLALFAAAVLACWLALEEIAPGAGARQGACLLLACPSMLDFACTSMDAVFLLFAALAWRSGLRALSPRGNLGGALQAGVLLLAATFFSFSALPLGFALLLHGVLAARREPVRAAGRLIAIGAAYAAAAILLHAATGFSIVACLLAARENALELMTRAVGTDPGSLALRFGQFGYGNLVAFAIGAGVASIAAIVAGLRARRGIPGLWTLACPVALLAMAFGGIYFMETERAWLYAVPWLAAVAVSSGPFDSASLRVLVGIGLLQALAMEIGLFTLW